MKRAIAVLLLSGALLAVGTGCGGGSQNGSAGSTDLNAQLTPYEKAMLRLGGLNTALTNVGLANRNATGPAEVVRNLRKSQVELRAAAAKLKKITPPARVKASHEQLIRGVTEYADELDAVIAKVQHGGGKRALGLIPSLKGLKDMAIASTAITKAGYVIAITNG